MNEHRFYAQEGLETEWTRAFGEWMREKIAGRGLTQEAVARGTRLGKSTISRYARGVAVPTPGVAARLALFFEVPIDEVFAVAGIRPPSDPTVMEWLSLDARAAGMESRLGELTAHMESLLDELQALRADLARLERGRVSGGGGSPPSSADAPVIEPFEARPA